MNNPNFHLGFNICALHFIDPLFFNRFMILLSPTYEVPPHQIILEITERDLLDKNNHSFFQ